MCQDIPAPPDDVDTSIPELGATETNRDRTSAHTADPTCAACHPYMDPLGRAFENYDLTFLVHASVDRDLSMVDHWMEQIGVSTHSLMGTRVGRR